MEVDGGIKDRIENGDDGDKDKHEDLKLDRLEGRMKKGEKVSSGEAQVILQNTWTCISFHCSKMYTTESLCYCTDTKRTESFLSLCECFHVNSCELLDCLSSLFKINMALFKGLVAIPFHVL